MNVAVRDEYAPRFGRQVLTLWSGPFASQFEGEAVELPRHDGFMVTLRGYFGAPDKRIRLLCAAPRDEGNWQRVDAAIAAAVRDVTA